MYYVDLNKNTAYGGIPIKNKKNAPFYLRPLPLKFKVHFVNSKSIVKQPLFSIAVVISS